MRCWVQAQQIPVRPFLSESSAESEMGRRCWKLRRFKRIQSTQAWLLENVKACLRFMFMNLKEGQSGEPCSSAGEQA